VRPCSSVWFITGSFGSTSASRIQGPHRLERMCPSLVIKESLGYAWTLFEALFTQGFSYKITLFDVMVKCVYKFRMTEQIFLSVFFSNIIIEKWCSRRLWYLCYSPGEATNSYIRVVYTSDRRRATTCTSLLEGINDQYLFGLFWSFALRRFRECNKTNSFHVYACPVDSYSNSCNSCSNYHAVNPLSPIRTCDEERGSLLNWLRRLPDHRLDVITIAFAILQC